MEAIAEKVVNILLSQYGVLGIIVIGLVLYILKKEKDHREERREMRAQFAAQHKEALEVTKGNTTVLAEVKTLIQTIANR